MTVSNRSGGSGWMDGCLCWTQAEKKETKNRFAVPLWSTKLSGSRENKSKMHVANLMKSPQLDGTSTQHQHERRPAFSETRHEKEIGCLEPDANNKEENSP